MNALLKSVYKSKAKKPSAENLVEEVKKEAELEKSKEQGKVKVTIRKKMFGKAPVEHTFYLKDGKQVKTMMELADQLEGMTDDVFQHHVNIMKNDFANWI